MDISVSPSPLNGEIDAISSKSDAHRLLICAALSPTPTDIYINGSSKDIQATVNCLTSMGCTIEQTGENRLTVTPLRQTLPEHPRLDCGESGSTLRFLLPVAASVFEGFSVTGGGRLPERPLLPVMEAMKANGCRFDKEQLPLAVSGRLHGGRFTLPGNVSSQFVSGLLFALPLLKDDSEIVLASELESVGYVNMTIHTLQKFGITVLREKNRFKVPGGQAYMSPGTAEAEGDWSNAAFWLAAGTLNGDISCRGLSLQSPQDDRRILDIVTKMGAKVSFEQGTAKVKNEKLTGITLDASDIPDLVPVLAAVMAAAEGTSEITNIGRLRLKESDRLHAVAHNLNAIGADVTEREDSLLIKGKPNLSGGTADGCNDHRIVMAMAIAGIACEKEVIIKGAEAVEKSYPGFFRDYEKLGGSIHVI